MSRARKLAVIHCRKRKRRALPEVLSPEEISAIFDACHNLKHKALLMTSYSRGPIPQQLHAFFRRVPKVCLTLLFEAVSETLLELARTNLKATIGFTAVLHTWNQQLGFHPHPHCVVPAEGSPSTDHGGSPRRSDSFSA